MIRYNCDKYDDVTFKILFETLQTLSLTDRETDRRLMEYLGDYLTEDIANEWGEPLIACVTELFKKKKISFEIFHVFNLIVANFDRVSKGGDAFDESIWTLEGFRYHPFWKRQRILAKRILDLLYLSP